MCNGIKLSLLAIAMAIMAMVVIPANAKEPVRIGVLAPAAVINGRAIFQAATMAAAEINSNGGIKGRQIKLYKLDTKGSATNSVRAFQRLVQQDHVIAVVGTYISEVALATEPWAARLKEPYIITGAAATKITERIDNNYERYKYVFRVNLNSAGYAKLICAQSHDVLVKQLGYDTAVLMSENFAWTKPFDKKAKKCLPKAGLELLDVIKIAPGTTSYTPIYHRIVELNPDVIIGVLAHLGLKPTVQWHKNRIPVLLAGWSSQAGTSSFWAASNGAAQGEITGAFGAPGAALTKKSIPFFKNYTKRFGVSPAYAAYTTYDAMYVLKEAIERADSTDAEALVKSLEKTDYLGTIGRIVFRPKDVKYTHDPKVGGQYITGVMVQWQNGEQVVLWPNDAATGHIIFPDFVPAPPGFEKSSE